MLGIEDLKDNIKIGKEKIECPVLKCKSQVDRISSHELERLYAFLENGRSKEEEFAKYLCPTHGIYIIPETFFYKEFDENLIWYDKDEENFFIKLLAQVELKALLAKDNAGEAMAWNIFRYIENNNLFADLFRAYHSVELMDYEVLYWGYSMKEASFWPELIKAIELLEINDKSNVLPELIIISSSNLLFINGRLQGESSHSPVDIAAWQKKGAAFLNESVLAGNKSCDRLTGLWILGSLIAKSLKLDFHFFNISREEGARPDLALAGFNQDGGNRFHDITWEDIYYQILSGCPGGKGKMDLSTYFMSKSSGYDHNKELVAAFSI